MEVTGQQLIGNKALHGSGAVVESIAPASGELLKPIFKASSLHDVEKSCALAHTSFTEYRNTSLQQRASFLEAIATEIDNLGDLLIQRAMQETGLPQARLQGERARTCGQLKLFAQTVRTGDWLDLRLDSALPDRHPLPRPDLRQRHIGVGPVAIFGASNFPLAFSVAGGDTASALAAGCPVVVKAHSAHVGTSELVGKAIQKAAADSGMPDGVFSLLFDASFEVGQALVSNKHIQAVGFTGSRSGGLALKAIADSRPVPIPVYAEMSSVNPVFLLAHALTHRPEDIATGFIASMTMGAGQFCTNPGLIIAQSSEALDKFVASSAVLIAQSPAQTMLTPGIYQAYEDGVKLLQDHPNVECFGEGQASDLPHQCQAKLFKTTASDFLNNKELQIEIFGATSILIECADEQEMINFASEIEGQLTATLHYNNEDLQAAKLLFPILETKAGRILFNGWPTGVEVSHAMVHGGPFPACSDTQTTSVGSAAINRFLRALCYQNFPAELIPLELQDENSLGLSRFENGERV